MVRRIGMYNVGIVLGLVNLRRSLCCKVGSMYKNYNVVGLFEWNLRKGRMRIY